MSTSPPEPDGQVTVEFKIVALVAIALAKVKIGLTPAVTPQKLHALIAIGCDATYDEFGSVIVTAADGAMGPINLESDHEAQLVLDALQLGIQLRDRDWEAHNLVDVSKSKVCWMESRLAKQLFQEMGVGAIRSTQKDLIGMIISLDEMEAEFYPEAYEDNAQHGDLQGNGEIVMRCTAKELERVDLYVPAIVGVLRKLTEMELVIEDFSPGTGRMGGRDDDDDGDDGDDDGANVAPGVGDVLSRDQLGSSRIY